jgi:hypothetical protein
MLFCNYFESREIYNNYRIASGSVISACCNSTGYYYRYQKKQKNRAIYSDESNYAIGSLAWIRADL